jgi:hypothetical protein
VHPLVEDGDDAERAVGQAFPVDDVAPVAGVPAVDAELGGDAAPDDFAPGDGGEGLEEAADIAVGLGLAPGLPRVAVDLVEPRVGGRRRSSA